MSCDKVREETTKKNEETPCGNRTVVLCKWNLDEVLKNSSERKVLIPVDGSDHSEHAFKFYLDNLHRSNDIVILVHTIELPPKAAVPFPDVGNYHKEWKTIIDRRRIESRDILGNYIELWENKHGKELNDKIVAVHDEHSIPGQGIVTLAKDYHATFIVIGSRGQGLLRRTFLGSVSDYVIHHSHVPVAVVPPSE